jgi:hypothetical protein
MKKLDWISYLFTTKLFNIRRLVSNDFEKVKMPKTGKAQRGEIVDLIED